MTIQKMSEERAIEELKKMYPKKCKMVDGRLKGGFDNHECKEGQAIDIAISALEEIQQYRAIGLTPQMVKDLIESCKKHEKNALENAHIVDEYSAIGTIEECREAMEKQRAKKPKRILDACCGSRMFWFDKENPDVVFADNRELNTTLCDGRRLIVKPDVKMDFRNIPYENETFKMVVFDPPHLIHAGEKSWLGQKYGILPTEWKPYLKKGFDECMRVLETDGVLIFKWNEEQIKTSEILSSIEYKPLFGDKRAKTHWLVFMK